MDLALKHKVSFRVFQTGFDRQTDPLCGAETKAVEFDEEKCRNVLVRYCAHIPRNYQYRDGIRLVFLVLRDHLGDEHLGHAGGVLYELVEIDCNHSDDPGAAFQRWRYDHMNRYANLELPHVPHLTTVTSAITPTATLAQWREEHPDRYRIRLSDHASSGTHGRSLSGCLRSRKDWMIDYTMYVSSRDGGTHPFRRIKAQQFHESQWNATVGKKGRLVEQKSVEPCERSVTSRVDGESRSKHTSVASTSSPAVPTVCRRPSDRWKLVKKMCTGKKSPQSPRRVVSLPPEAASRSMTATSLTELLEPKPVPLMGEWEIPNANFARKFGIFTGQNPLPTSIKELPVAEDNVVDKVVDSPKRGLFVRGSHGPFTPQLWFDNGLEFRWGGIEPKKAPVHKKQQGRD